MSLVMCAGLTCTVLFIKMTKPPEALSWGLYPVQFQLCALSSEGKLLTIVDCALFYVDCALFYVDCALFYVDCALFYVDCALFYVDCALFYVDCALFYVDWLFSRLNGGRWRLQSSDSLSLWCYSLSAVPCTHPPPILTNLRLGNSPRRSPCEEGNTERPGDLTAPLRAQGYVS